MEEAIPQPLSGAAARLVIVGAGLAGLRVAEGARAAGYDGHIVLVGEEPHMPYDRPPLSKAFLLRQSERDQISLLHPKRLEELNIELKLGRAATAVDRPRRAVLLEDGDSVHYDRLVIATGSSPRAVPQLPPDRSGVHYLRSLDDATALREGLVTARQILVVGAGVIGLEVAAAAMQNGRRVTVVEAGNRVMSRAAAPAVTDFITRKHRQAGVDLRLGVHVSHVEQMTQSYSIHLSDGAVLSCDLIVVGIGVMPNDSLARNCGLEVRPGGILVNSYGMTSDPAVFAAGEVALHFNARQGRHDRQETWAHASAHGEHVGRSLIAPSRPYEELGSYWSDQYDFTLNVIGVPIGDCDVVRGDSRADQLVVLHLQDGRVAGASSINAARELRAARALIDVERRFDPEVLANPETDLRRLAKG